MTCTQCGPIRFFQRIQIIQIELLLSFYQRLEIFLLVACYAYYFFTSGNPGRMTEGRWYLDQLKTDDESNSRILLFPSRFYALRSGQANEQDENKLNIKLNNSTNKGGFR